MRLTARYSPQQNGVTERKNHTIVEMARSMMAGKELPKFFWAEAVNTSVYILNRSPTKMVLNKTLYEAWHQRKPQSWNWVVDQIVPSQPISPIFSSKRRDQPSTSDDERTSSGDIELESESPPQNFDEAAKEKVWKKAMDEEIACIEKNHTWELVDLSDGKNVIGFKWIYKTKYKEDGSIHKHKARLVAKGYSQQLGVDFTEIFASVEEWRQSVLFSLYLLNWDYQLISWI
ncbi:UNVERIFIED_CONTAM: Copia protein [Sesamum radiatum]|uniref:Copia protein n=1 Tax=Sesamum radiatum TaxID=300843 RepID=A0AAW2LL70_SESRA